jgi:hypothetical protein
MEDAKGNKYDMAGNLIPPTDNTINDAVTVARREIDPYLKVPGHEHLKAVPPVTPPRPEYVPGEAISAATQPSRDVFWQGVEQFRNPQTEPRTPERAWELLSGAGQIGLGALGTASSGVIGAGVEALPTWLTGNQNQRNKLASELNEMTAFIDPALSPTAPIQRVGGIRNAAIVEGDLAKQRMLERGPSKLYDPLRVSSGVDPTEAGKAVANLKDAAIAKVGQTAEGTALKAAQDATGTDQPALAAKTAGQQLVDDQMEAIQPPSMPANVSPDAPTKAFVQFGKPIPPSVPPPDPALLQKAQADTRMGADIVKRRLPVIVPEQERVIGGVYTPGTPDGRRWSELTPQELSVRGSGAGFTDADLQKIWDQTLAEVSEAGRQAVANTGATWKVFPAKQWDKALKLPLRSQLWYELSGEAFVDRLPDLKYNEHMMFLDLVGATSARARPGENLERALAVLSQRLRGVPVDVDVTIPSTVSAALRRDGRNVSSDLANKTGMFSDTLALTGGLPTRYPISVNDVWVGKAFGITDDQLSSNQALHEVFGKYTNKLRDLVNSTSPSPYPHQSWNLQSRQWVELRAADEGIDTSLASVVEGSDYAGEWGKVLQKLQNAGIDVPEGKITRDVLMDPRFADALRSTTPAFRAAPKATVEFGTLLTPNGQKAANLYDRARQIGDQNTQDEYLSTLTTSMYRTARGKPTLWELTARTALGDTTSVTRIYSPNTDDPFAISGTFAGAAAPNIRVPLRRLTPDQIAYFNAVAGQGLRQKAMAAVEITRLDPDQALPEGAVLSRAVRFDFDGPVPQKMLTDFASALGEGFEISAMRYPDGMVFDINPRFGDAGPEAPSVKAVDDAIDAIAKTYGIENPKVFDISYKSEYGKNYVEDPGDGTGYGQIINDTLKGWEANAVAQLRVITEGKFSDAVLKRYLKGNDAALKDAAQKGGIPVSGYTGRAKTVRKVFQQRLSNHADITAQWNAVGKEIDDKLGALIPKWERRYTQAEKRSIKEAPQRAAEQGFTTEAYRGSNRDIQEYGPRASESGYYGGKPTYFTSSPEDATGYARVPLEEYDVSPYDQLKILQETNPQATLQDVMSGNYPGLAEEYANRIAGGENLGAVYPSKLRMKNPVRVGGEGETVFKGNQATEIVKITANTLAQAGIPEATAIPILSKLDNMLQSGGFGAMDFDLAVRNAVKESDKRLLPKIGSILADVYQKAGFDSIDLDASVFSDRRAGSYSYRTPQGARHYMVFDPENIRGRFAKFGGYGPEGPAYMKAMGGAVDDEDIDNALRLARAMGGRIGYAEAGSVPVMMEDAKGNKYDAQGNLIPPTTPGPNPARTPTPQEVGQKASMDPATFDALMQQYAVPDRDIAQYEATKAAVAAQPREIQQMTHVGDRPTREVKVDMPLFGGEYSVGSAPYDVAGNMSGVAQTAYDLKTVPFYAIPLTAPIAAGMDVAEGVATNDPLTASLAVGFGPGGKYAKAAGIGAVNYFMDPAEAEAGPARWFSKAVEAARNVPMNKMTGEQALAMLRKGVSPEELKWIGADRFLPGQESITKQDLIDYLEKNRVGTKDVVLGGNKPTRLADVMVEDIPVEIRQKYQPKINELLEKKVRANLAARGLKQSLGGDPANPRHLSDQNYLRLMQDAIDYNGEIIDLNEAMKQEYIDSIGGLGEPLRYGPGSRYGDKYVTRGGENYRETLITLPTSEYGKLYQSGHWEGVPNVVGHIRTQILDVTPPGANRPYKAFNVDEAQSDYAKSGREKGFVTAEDKASLPNLVKQYDDLNKQRREAERIVASGDDTTPEVREAAIRMADLNRQMMDLSDKMTAIRSGGVPVAPYVTSTQNWTDLSIKKALDQAMDAGADYFTYTPGQAQAERYDLSKHIKKLQYNPDDGSLLAYDPKGKMVINESVNDPDDLDEYLGKELADKMRLEAESRRSVIDEYEIAKDEETGEWGVYLYGEPSGETFSSKRDARDYLNELVANEFAQNPPELSGLDLRVGGEGMRDYYDNIYKKRVEKVVKDATGKKVQWEVIPVQTADGPREQLGFRITDMQDARFSDFNKGGRVTDRAKYADSDTVSRALALTSEV